MRVNYQDCDYSDQEDTDEAENEYPCRHPSNWEGECALDNHKDGRRDTCPLLDE